MVAIDQIIMTFIQRFADIITAPTHHTEMIWILIPLLTVIIMMIFYFSRYKDEELGWNTALGNSLIIIFVSIDLLRTIYTATNPGTIQNFSTNLGATVLVLLLFLVGIVMMFVNFSHILPKKIAYLLSSALPINLMAYVMITIIYSKVPIDVITIIAAIIFLALLLLIFTGIGYMTRRWWTRIEHLKAKEKVEDVKKETKVLKKVKEEVKEKEKNIKKAVKQEKKEVKQKQVELKNVKAAINQNNHKKKKGSR